MYKIYFVFVFCFLIDSFVEAQKVGIGTSTPHTSSVLDIQSSTKGILIPRMALTSTDVAAPVTNPANSLLIYNTATAGNNENAVSPGYYFWNSTSAKWISATSFPTQNTSGLGTWQDCRMTNITDYNPVAANDGAVNDEFGYAVSISGNYAVIGARGDNNVQGAAYVFFYNGTSWIQQQKLIASDGASSDYFGASVSIDDNLIIVGAFGDNNFQGSAYIYLFNGTSWIQQQKLTASDGLANDLFGVSVSLDGNLAVIGASGDNSSRGSAYGFRLNAGVWSQFPIITAPSGLAGDQFGSSVSVYANTLMVGAPQDQVSGQNSRGSVHVFNYNGTSWSFTSMLTSSNGAAFDAFGYALSLYGNSAVIGAPGKNNSTGSAYIFSYINSVWTQTQFITVPDGLAGDDFGFTVAIHNNYAMIGSLLDDINSTPPSIDQGSAFIFQNISGVWLRLQQVINPLGSSQDNFGVGCAIADKNFLISSNTFAESRGMAVFGKIK